ncbi:hypothetical protein CT0861_05317 [Colletotrichum tofieldiae]|uniref:Uncharacterized protein n=1 Tax=Colletotrichum tofieldiae TaxID=708197 RepID=A0A166WIA5_9PEZI|nr:hypothetical protein CT0861_05317 [Colletotrichum tofieldiae]
MSASEPSLSFDKPRLALICQAAKIRAIPTTDSATDLLESDQVRNFSTSVSHFISPRHSVWRQMSESERCRLLEARYPKSANGDQMADACTFNKLFKEWYRDLVHYMPEVLLMTPRQPTVAVARNIKPNRSTRFQEDQDGSSRYQEAHYTLNSHIVAKDANTEKTFHIVIRRIRDGAKQIEALASKRTKPTPSSRTRLTTLSSISVAAEDTGTDKLQQQYRLSDKVMARLGRRHKAPARKSKSTPIYC